MRFTKNTPQDASKVLRLPRKMTMDASKVLRLPRKLQHIFWKRRKSIAPATQNDFRHVAEHVWMSRSATPATRNEATRRLKPPKRTTSVKLPIGTAIRSSRERLRTVADGCGRLRSRTQRRANRPSTPRPPEWNGNPCYAFGKKQFLDGFPFIYIYIDIYIYHLYRCFSRQSLHHTYTDPATVATGADAGATHRVHRVRRAARCGRRGTWNGRKDAGEIQNS